MFCSSTAKPVCVSLNSYFFPIPEQKAFHAARIGNIDDLRKCQTLGVDLSKARDEISIETPFHKAVRGNHVKTVYYLINNGGIPLGESLQNGAGETPLHVLVKTPMFTPNNNIGSISVLLEMLLKEFPKWCLVQDFEGNTPLHLAAANKMLTYNSLEKLYKVTKKEFSEIRDECSPLVDPNKNGDTVIHQLFRGRHSLFAEKVFKAEELKSEEFSKRNNEGYIPLHLFLEHCLGSYNMEDALNQLLSRAPDTVNSVNPNGDRPLEVILNYKERLFGTRRVSPNNKKLRNPYGPKEFYNRLLNTIISYKPNYLVSPEKSPYSLMDQLLDDPTIEERTLENLLNNVRNIDLYETNSNGVAFLDRLINETKIYLLIIALNRSDFDGGQKSLSELCVSLCDRNRFCIALDPVGFDRRGLDYTAKNDHRKLSVFFINKCAPDVAKEALNSIQHFPDQSLLANAPIDVIGFIETCLKERSQGKQIKLSGCEVDSIVRA